MKQNSDRIREIKEYLYACDISNVFLDMDGTLLDKYFDTYFWGHLVPEKYAEKHNITFGRAEKELLIKYEAHKGTLNWMDIDFWSRELGLDIMALKEQIRHLIEVHPHVEDFLKAMKLQNKKVFIITNAHYKVLDAKLKYTDLGAYLTGAITSFEVGYPKEDIRFWQEAQRQLGFNNDDVLFIDDTLNILRAAKQFGLKWLIYKARADHKAEPVESNDFPFILDFEDLL